MLSLPSRESRHVRFSCQVYWLSLTTTFFATYLWDGERFTCCEAC